MKPSLIGDAKRNHAGSTKFCQTGSKFDNVFFFFLCFFFVAVDKGLEDLNTTKNGPRSARQRNAI